MSVSETCLRFLPEGKFVRCGRMENQFGYNVDVVVWRWLDRGIGGVRTAAFDRQSGAYVGDTQ